MLNRDIRVTGRKTEPLRMSGLDKVVLLQLVGRGPPYTEHELTQLRQLHYALRCHFCWEDRYSASDPRTGSPKADVLDEVDFDPTDEHDSTLARRMRLVLASLQMVSGEIPPGLSRVLWEIAREKDIVPTLEEVDAARTVYEMGQAALRIHWIAKLTREEMGPDCLACTKDEPCQACRQTARIVGRLEGGF